MVAAGGRAYAAQFNDLLVSADDTNPGTVAANFTVSQARARTALGGLLVFVNLVLTNTNTLTPTGANIVDTVCYTLDSEYWPTEALSGSWGANPGFGDVLLNVDGSLTLRTTDATVNAGSTLRMHLTYLRAA